MGVNADMGSGALGKGAQIQVGKIIYHLPTPVAVVKVQETGRWEILHSNWAFSKTFAITSEEAQGRDLWRFYDWDRTVDAVGQLAESPDDSLSLEATARDPLEGGGSVMLTVSAFDLDDHILVVSAREANVESLSDALHDVRDQLYQLIQDSTDMNFVLDTRGILVEINRAGAAMLKRQPEELVGTAYAAAVHPDDLPRVREALSRVLHRRVERFDARLMSRADEPLLVEVLARPTIEDGVVVGVLGRARDITEQRGIENRLQQSEQSYRALYDDNVDAVSTFSPDGVILYANPATAAMLGTSREEVLNTNFIDYIVPSLRDQTFAEFSQVLEGRTVQYETAMHNSRNEVIDLHITVIPLVIDGEVRAVHCIGKDITERKQMRRALHDMAYRDAVTGLPNANSLGTALDSAIRAGDPFDLMIIDMDRLKVINDTWGREIGDQLLAAVAERLGEGMGATEQLFRHTGDDFVALRPHTDVTESLSYARSLDRTLRAPFSFGEVPVKASVSIGISSFPIHGSDAHTLLRNADDAMLHAKKSGQYHVAMHRELDPRQGTRALKMELELRHAIANRELALVYQPQVDLKTGVLHGTETLLRWQHREFGAVSPSEFIPLAERAGLIHEIGMWVLESACRQQARWRSTVVGELPVAVNISVDQFYDIEFAHHLERTIRNTGINPQSLTLEITETIASQSDIVVEQLHRFAAIGTRIAIDDFGTGYSSLRYLKDFPVDFVKIDRSFVSQIEASKSDRDLIATIVSLAHNFGLETIAEGVETIAQVDFLREQGAEFAQGYYLGRPMHPEQFERWLTQRRTSAPPTHVGIPAQEVPEA